MIVQVCENGDLGGTLTEYSVIFLLILFDDPFQMWILQLQSIYFGHIGHILVLSKCSKRIQDKTNGLFGELEMVQFLLGCCAILWSLVITSTNYLI